MSKTLHVAKSYDIRWGNHSDFNWKIYEFHRLLTVLGAEYSGEPFDDEFDVSDDDLVKAASDLEHYDMLNEDTRIEIDNALKGLGCSLDEAATSLWKYVEEGDCDDGYYHFSFF